MAIEPSIAEIEKEMLIELARRISTLRRLEGFGHGDLALAAGMSRDTLSKIENARNLASLHQLTRLSVALKVPLYILFAPMSIWQNFIVKEL